MSVSTNAALPNTDFTQVRETSLGGSGWDSPSAMIHCMVQNTGDATGGQNVATIRLDPVYLSLVMTLSVSADGQADVPYQMAMRVKGSFAQYQISGTMVFVDVGAAATWLMCTKTWAPSPVLIEADVAAATIAPTLQGRIPNVDGQVFQLEALIFQFQKRAMEVTPVEKLLASVPRGVTSL